jgi:LuxR family transcriptional regulator, maltose regulon positive regulatory protein
VRVVTLSFLSFVATDEGHLEEAESRARAAQALVERLRPYRIPQTSLAPIALGRALAELGRLEEAQKELENGLSRRRELPGLSPWPTLIGLLALTQVRTARGDRAGARTMLAEARAMLEAFPDAGIFPELLERQERKLRARRPREGQLDGELTERELDVPFPRRRVLHPADRAEPLRRPEHGKNPGQVHLPQARGLLARCSRG